MYEVNLAFMWGRGWSDLVGGNAARVSKPRTLFKGNGEHFEILEKWTMS